MPISPLAKLVPNALDLKSIEKKPTRDGYGLGLVEAADENLNVVALCADLTESTRTEAFAKKYPERFVEMGVAEQNMASVAAGMALMGDGSGDGAPANGDIEPAALLGASINLRF